MPSAPTLRRLAAIRTVCRALSATTLRRTWIPRAHFGTGRRVNIGRTTVSIWGSLHVLPAGAADGPLSSTIMISPHASARSATDRGLARTGWYVACERLLRRHGYRGRWRRGSWGVSGVFSRRHADAASLVSQMAKIEAVVAEPWASLAAPSNKALQLTGGGGGSRDGARHSASRAPSRSRRVERRPQLNAGVRRTLEPWAVE
jgi:hypothetical protein